MPKVTVFLDGGGQITVETTRDKTPLQNLETALKDKKAGKEFRVTYPEAVIIVPDGEKVLGGAVSGL
jgi:hypothetical protein